jgi:hypothetical protein
VIYIIGKYENNIYLLRYLDCHMSLFAAAKVFDLCKTEAFQLSGDVAQIITSDDKNRHVIPPVWHSIDNKLLSFIDIVRTN